MKKLVRDKIPEIIKKEYWYVDFFIINEDEYKKFLFEKILKEFDEVYETKKN